MAAGTAWEIASAQLRQAASLAQLSPESVALLAEPERVLTVRLPVCMDDGKLRVFVGFRVQHSHALGPIQGGTRIAPDETLDDIKALALWMTVKNAVAGLPAGGGKGGIIADPKALSLGELERLCRAYVRAISPLMGSWRDYPGADIGTDVRTMSWMLDEWEQIHGMRHEPAAVSGKAVILGGSQGRAGATGLGVCYALRESCRVLGLGLAGLRVAVQGFGKVGSWAARFINREGAKIVAVSDVYGGVAKEEGVDVDELAGWVNKHGTVRGYPGGEAMARDDILQFPCDALVLAAVQGVIRADNAEQVRARIIVEGANGPITPEADEILARNGVFIVPDVLANNGGTTVAYLEKVQGFYHYYWTEAEVYEQYDRMFRQAFNAVLGLAEAEKISMRMAAWVLGLRRVVEAMVARGWVKE